MLLLLFVVFYFFMIRPQSKKQKEIQKFRESMRPGDKVITAGGIYGKVVKIEDSRIVLEISKGVNIDLNSYLFGSIMSTSWGDVVGASVLTGIVILLYLFAFHRIFAITFDENFAKSIGIKTGIYDIIFAVICSTVVVLGMRLLGSLLISSLIIFPTLSAMSLAKTFKGATILSVIISVLAFIIGLIISFFIATPTGATVVLVNLAIFLITKLSFFREVW